jgi:hypothetical protein
VSEIVGKAKRAGINLIVVDVKPLSGEVLYMSRHAPRLSEVKGFRYPPDFDLLRVMIEQGHAAGVPVDADINVFSEGHRHWSRGPAYSHPEWQVVSHEPHGFALSQDSTYPSFGVFVNPIGPARAYELAIIEEIVSGYEIDGIIFDRMRYPNLYGDFGETSRLAFHEWLGSGGLVWPDDVFRQGADGADVIRGRYYKEWLEWRAQQIKEFATEACSLVRSIKPQVQVGTYVGSWYDAYYNEGVNWGSEEYQAGCSWMTPRYNKTGYAELFDYICTGCYYPHVTKEEAHLAGCSEAHSVEAACEMSRTAIGSASKFYGSLYLLDYKDDPSELVRAMDMVLDKTEGIMLFDLVYLEDYDWWPILQDAWERRRPRPHPE